MRVDRPGDARRFLQLEGAGNVRDLGGLPTADGRRTRSGRVLRSDLLVRLHPADENELVQRYGLRTVIDLRTPREIERVPGPWEGTGVDVVCASLPIDPAFEASRREDLVDFYLQFLESPATQLPLALSTLLDLDAHPVLIHCAAGKDRTGVVVALALELLGVERQAVIADYALTHTRMPAVIARLEAEAGRPPSRNPPEVYGADPRTVGSFLTRFDERFGSAHRWALSNGIEERQIESFRAAMLEPSG